MLTISFIEGIKIKNTRVEKSKLSPQVKYTRPLYKLNKSVSVEVKNANNKTIRVVTYHKKVISDYVLDGGDLCLTKYFIVPILFHRAKSLLSIVAISW